MNQDLKVTSRFPLAFNRPLHGKSDHIVVAAGDIGGTKTNLALYLSTDHGMECVREQTYPSGDFKVFTDLISQFLSSDKDRIPDRICLGIAGPVLNGKVRTTNLAWELDAKEISKKTRIGKVALINDLEATCYGLAGLKTEDLTVLHQGTGDLPGNAAVIAPGTGLGEAGMYWDGQHFHPFATEGGHSEFFPRDDFDLELYGYLQSKFGIVSWERLISGPGIVHIYEFLREVKHMQEPNWLAAEIKGEDPGAAISHSGVHNTSSICQRTMQLFVRYLAHESTSLVLKYKATGGLFIGGGIPPKIIELLKDRTLFYEEFLQSDRMKELVGAVPVKVIMNSNCALLGAAYYGAYGIGD